MLLGSQCANGKGALEGSVVRRGSEVACVRGGGRKGMRVWQKGLMFRHCLGARMDKRQNMSV